MSLEEQKVEATEIVAAKKRMSAKELFQNRFVVLGIIVLGLIIIFTIIGFVTRGAQEKAEQGGSFTVAVTTIPTSLDPIYNTSNQTESMMHHLFANLMKQTQDKDGNVIVTGDMAENYSVTENYDGSTTYTFYLRKTAVWSDGVPVKAEDFVYSWRRLLSSEEGRNASSFYLDVIRGYKEAVEKNDPTLLQVSAVDTSTFQVTLTGHCTYFLSDTCCTTVTAPLRSDMASGWENDATKLLYNGAYKISEWSLGNTLFIEKNSEYYDVANVKAGSITFRWYVNDTAAYEAYQANQVDFLINLPDSVIRDKILSSSDSTETGEYQISALPSVFSVAFNCQVEGFNDTKVRAAFSLALDRNSLVSTLGGGRMAAPGLVPYGVVDDAEDEDFRSTGGDLVSVSTDEYKRNKSTAQQYLREAGYPNGDGFPHTTYSYVNTAENAALARQLQLMWENVLGVSVELVPLSVSEHEKVLQKGNYAIAGYEITSSVNDPLMFLQQFTTESEDNVLLYSNHIYDLLIKASIHFTVEGSHCAYLHDAERILLTEDYAISPLYFNTTSSATRQGLTGVFKDNDGHYYFYNVDNK